MNIPRRALVHYGIQRQTIKALEELSELSTILHHWMDKRADAREVVEEIADVWIMVEQLREHFGPATVDAAIAYKLERLAKRMAA